MKRNGDGNKMDTLKIGKTKTVVFSLSAPHARRVSVTGDFNGWSIKSHSMERDKSGVWKRSVALAPGHYEYLFVVDEAWEYDPHKESEPNPFGSLNNVIRVE